MVQLANFVANARFINTDTVVLEIIMVFEGTNLVRNTNRGKKSIHAFDCIEDRLFRNTIFSSGVFKNMRYDGKFFLQARQRFLLEGVTLSIEACCV
jgi:hypothetical protein